MTMASVSRLKDRREAAFAACRSMGHEWHHQAALGIDDDREGLRRPFGATVGMIGFPSTCSMCGTERVRWITRSGEVITRYEHPEGYSRHGEDRLSVAEWRRSYVETVFTGFLDVPKAPRKRGAS